jgi:hypothetical protein
MMMYMVLLVTAVSMLPAALMLYSDRAPVAHDRQLHTPTTQYSQQ